MAFPKPPEKIVPFNSGPVAPHDIGRQFDEHRRTFSNVIDFLRTVVRDDGVVRNGTVGPEQLAPELPETLAKQATASVEALLTQVRQSASVAAAYADEARALRDQLGALQARIALSASAMELAGEEVQKRLSALDAQIASLNFVAPTLGTGVLGPDAGQFFATDEQSAGPLAQDYAQVSIEWAEHMPDIIPPNILAINAITGQHWSSRWWASKAASIVSTITGTIGAIPGTVGVWCENLIVTGGGGIPNLSKTPAGPVLLVMNGQAFLPVGSQPPFAVVGQAITWLSPIYALFPGTEVAVWYPYAP